ncbi:MAG: transcriptional repressor [Phycisphaerales bacterium]
MIIDYHYRVAQRSRYTDEVLRVVNDAGRPVSVDEIREALRESGVGTATVYRVVNGCVEGGQLKKVELPNAAARFEPADLPHHHHFECDSCRKVYDVPGCAHGVIDLAPDGFEVSQHEILLKGKCAECLGASA